MTERRMVWSEQKIDQVITKWMLGFLSTDAMIDSNVPSGLGMTDYCLLVMTTLLEIATDYIIFCFIA